MAWVEGDDEKTWKLCFDGSKCQKGIGVGISLVSLEGGIILIAYKLNFDYNNNMAEYESLVLGFKDSINLSVKNLQVYGDSQLIINKINKIYNTKMKNYNHTYIW